MLAEGIQISKNFDLAEKCQIVEEAVKSVTTKLIQAAYRQTGFYCPATGYNLNDLSSGLRLIYFHIFKIC